MEAGHKDGGQWSGRSALTQNRSYNEQAEASCPGRSPQNCWRQEGWQVLEGSGGHTRTCRVEAQLCQTNTWGVYMKISLLTNPWLFTSYIISWSQTEHIFFRHAAPHTLCTSKNIHMDVC